MNAPLHIAHRGAVKVAPENTTASVLEAIALGADLIEIDIQQTSDHQWVVIHDATVDRTTNRSGKVSDYSLADLQEMDNGSWFDPKFNQLRISSLSEIIALTRDKCRLLIEIKTPHDYGTIKDSIAGQLEPHCALQSFDERVVDLLAGLPYPIYQLFDTADNGITADNAIKYINKRNGKHLTGFNPCVTLMSQQLVDAIHELGKTCFVWTVNNEDDYQNILALSVDGIITDHHYFYKKQ